ncbi:MAG TPA: hypothetical protein VK472_07180 [Allosphingosinicella sp.]|nr:hypothetical protein [Allosphingosinicella sp.]
MSLVLAAFMLASQPAAPMPEHVLRFHYYRVVAFQARARELHCEAGDLDRELEQVRRRLNRRYGKDAFKPFAPEPGGPGDCLILLRGYRSNLDGFRKDAEAALNAPSPAASTAPQS